MSRVNTFRCDQCGKLGPVIIALKLTITKAMITGENSEATIKTLSTTSVERQVCGPACALNAASKIIQDGIVVDTKGIEPKGEIVNGQAKASDPVKGSEKKILESWRENEDNGAGKEAKKFLDHFFQEYVSEFKVKPIISGAKEMKLIKGLLKYISFDVLGKLLLRFFKSTDRWVKDSGYTVAAFHSQINKLQIQMYNEEAGRKGTPGPPAMIMGPNGKPILVTEYLKRT